MGHAANCLKGKIVSQLFTGQVLTFHFRRTQGLITMLISTYSLFAWGKALTKSDTGGSPQAVGSWIESWLRMNWHTAVWGNLRLESHPCPFPLESVIWFCEETIIAKTKFRTSIGVKCFIIFIQRNLWSYSDWGWRHTNRILRFATPHHGWFGIQSLHHHQQKLDFFFPAVAQGNFSQLVIWLYKIYIDSSLLNITRVTMCHDLRF